MAPSPSKLAAGRRHGLHQVDEQREHILDAAERLFLAQGLEGTKMIEIAAAAGITKMSLYRYFPNRDVIAVEIHKRMLNRIAALLPVGEAGASLEMAKELARAMIRNFTALRDAYRYMGMFDQLYLDHPSETALAQWTKELLASSAESGAALEEISREAATNSRFLMVLSAVIWFLEKLALRGELTWSDQAVPLDIHLRLFEEMVVGYIERSLSTDAGNGLSTDFDP